MQANKQETNKTNSGRIDQVNIKVTEKYDICLILTCF